MSDQEDTPNPLPEMKETAYGIAKNMKTGEWELIKVAYDPVSGRAAVKERCHTGGYRMMAEEVFRITVAQELLI